MSIDLDNPTEFSPTPLRRQEVKEGLQQIELQPGQMYEIAQDALGDAPLTGTNLKLDIKEKRDRPTAFSYDVVATTVGLDQGSEPIHEGYARIYVPSEGARKMLDEDGKPDFLGGLVSQWLKANRKGQQASVATEAGTVTESKAGKLSDEQRERLECAKLATIETLVDWVAARKAGATCYRAVDKWARTAVSDWVDCSPEEARTVVQRVVGGVVDVLLPPQEEDGER